MLNVRDTIRGALAAAVVTFSTPASAGEILFALVGAPGIAYSSNGYELAGHVNNLPGMNVRTLHIDPFQGFRETNGSVAAPINWDGLDQVWVYDLSSQTDNSAQQLNAYQQIADWYFDKGRPDIIADGRIIGSTSQWYNRPAGGSNPGTGVPEDAYIQNYATQLDLHGGGLVLGTDHATTFTRGINEINQRIGLNDFTNFYSQAPYRAEVDPDSALFVDGLTSCGLGFAPDATCINDNSSTGDAPFNLQPGGQILYPTAWHGGDITRVAVSTTMRERLSPPEDPPTGISEPGATILFGIGIAGLSYVRRRKTA